MQHFKNNHFFFFLLSCKAFLQSVHNSEAYLGEAKKFILIMTLIHYGVWGSGHITSKCDCKGLESATLKMYPSAC